MPIEKSCEQCGKTFAVKPAREKRTRFCSVACQKARRETAHATLTCEHCGSPFEVARKRERTRRFCGKPCQTAHEAVHGRPAAQVAPVEFACKQCGKPFFYKPAYLTEYRKKFDKDPMYCSTPCAGAAHREESETRVRFACLNCGKENSNRRKPGGRIYAQQKYCDVKCKSEHHIKLCAERFRQVTEAGQLPRHLGRNGYVRVSVPSGVTGKKHTVFEHRWVMSQHLGRELLPDETVHHRDGNRQHNAIENLELFSSRHGPGQRVIDKVDFAIDMLLTYPEFAAVKGYKLVASDVDHAGHVSDATPDLRRAPC